ncbi:MAG: SDR family NAD(P)-dependent oxidoreductase [Chloroflexota bacterium]
MSRSVVISGAAEGIGLAMARLFAEAGDRVAMLDFNAARLDAAVADLAEDGLDVFGHQTDVRQSSAVQAAFAEAVARHGGVDVAISNAGVYPNSPVVDLEEDEWDRVMDTNLKGTFLFCRAAARQMIAQGSGGKICTMASGASRSARRGGAHYCASKAGVVLFSQALALELAEHRINVNIVAPGFVDVGDRPGVSAPYRAAITQGIPWGRAGRAADIAQAVRWVCSAEADFLTGAYIPVDGGASAGRFFLPLST